MNNTIEQNKSNKRILANILLVLTTLLWGTTFIITKTLTQSIPIFLYLGLRYLIGTIGFIPLFFHFKFLSRKIYSRIFNRYNLLPINGVPNLRTSNHDSR